MEEHNACTMKDLVARMRREHHLALEASAVGESPFMHYLDQYFEHTGRWSRTMAEAGYVLVPVPMVNDGNSWFAAPQVMREYAEASDLAPRYLHNWMCDGCAAEASDQDCGAAFKVCGRLLFADLLARELTSDEA